MSGAPMWWGEKGRGWDPAEGLGPEGPEPEGPGPEGPGPEGLALEGPRPAGWGWRGTPGGEGSGFSGLLVEATGVFWAGLLKEGASLEESWGMKLGDGEGCMTWGGSEGSVSIGMLTLGRENKGCCCCSDSKSAVAISRSRSGGGGVLAGSAHWRNVSLRGRGSNGAGEAVPLAIFRDPESQGAAAASGCCPTEALPCPTSPKTPFSWQARDCEPFCSFCSGNGKSPSRCGIAEML